MDVKFSGQVEDNNTARARYMQYTANHGDNLGPQTFRLQMGNAFGWGFEAYRFVYPSDFNYPNAGLRLEALPGSKDFRAQIPPGNDLTTDRIGLRDDDPVASRGMIFDLDFARIRIATLLGDYAGVHYGPAKCWTGSVFRSPP
jgi:hypothetical protein